MSTPDPAAPTRRTLMVGVPALAAAALTGLAGCSILEGVAPGSPARALRAIDSLPTKAKPTTPPADIASSTAAALAASNLGRRLLTQRLTASPRSNALVCPVGITLTLAILYAQASTLGKGVAELLADPSTGTDADATQRDTRWRRAQLALQRFDVASLRQLQDFDAKKLPEKPLVHVANNLLLVGTAKDSINQSYVDAARTWYDADVNYVALDRAGEALDAWTTLHTGGMIRKSGLTLGADTRLVIQNAVLLAARWSLPFRATNTLKDQPFKQPGNSETRADLLVANGHFTLVEEPDWQALRLPYGVVDPSQSTGRGLALDVVLPRQTISPTELGEGVWAEATTALTAAEDKGKQGPEVHLRLPRLDLSTEATDLLAELKTMGVELGNLEHLGVGLAVDQTVQQARLMVDEEGTVAAALTEANVGVRAPLQEDEPVEFFADHPFVARIVDTATGMPVFEVVVMDPASHSAL
ncbi:Serine protease inhibitor [Actinomyces bovis]|uniref:Serine protease inhibitor n=1 Tax=Actinomyces bovis TaxID=1658 RepID=A0ABY1VNG9_9ACTO|nr:serpin family protein [Actinomyces bovis]SPT53655.1 Serine protease inhibitor [Actinomyces bovis]VEG55740.1 Serine protease inhibitor [Actinomyces israelii]